MGGGLSRERLDRMHDVMAGYVERERLPGLVTGLYRRGEAHVDSIGTTALESGDRRRRETIFRLASRSKPTVAAAAMTMVEDGTLRLDDPVDELLPELANRKVLRSIESDLDDTVPAKRAITLRDLLTFRLGLGLVFSSTYPIVQAMDEAGVAPGPVFVSVTPDEFMKRVGTLPLMYQPGERWLYHTGADILGVLIARAAGSSLGAFMAERLFAPLGMKDTGF